MSTSYEEFIQKKSQLGSDGGFAPTFMPSFLFPFQASLVEWSLRKGRAAILANCGMGKTPMLLVWAENVVRKTNRPVLILTPLAVSAQTIREGEKFGIEVRRPVQGESTTPGVYVCNYERLHYLSPEDYAGVVCDESSALKSFDGSTRMAVTRFMRGHRFRLLCSATPAPNDYVELGTSSEALGELGHMDMLNKFFTNNRNNSAKQRAWANAGGGNPTWRFRGHAEQPFWRWVCSWARSVCKPSDIGDFDDTPFVLPELVEREHTVKAIRPREGFLFSIPAVGLSEEREERRRTLTERCEMAASLVADTGQPAVVWCHLNDEGEALERMIPGSVQVSGNDEDDEKERKFESFATGQSRVLISKPVIAAWGLNWQHCAHMTSFASHSFEQYFQSIRRSWRFGQTRPVVIDHIVSDGEHRVLANLRRKSEMAEAMAANITRHMQEAMGVKRIARDASTTEAIPTWL